MECSQLLFNFIIFSVVISLTITQFIHDYTQIVSRTEVALKMKISAENLRYPLLLSSSLGALFILSPSIIFFYGLGGCPPSYSRIQARIRDRSRVFARKCRRVNCRILKIRASMIPFFQSHNIVDLGVSGAISRHSFKLPDRYASENADLMPHLSSESFPRTLGRLLSSKSRRFFMVLISLARSMKNRRIELTFE